jgi:hypothetical protein
MTSKAFFYVFMYQLITPAIQYVNSTAGSYVQRYWAQVQALQNQVCSIISYSVFSFGLWLVRRHFLHSSWRCMLAVTTILLYVIDMPFTLLTTFDVIRNQYFYLGETVATTLPEAINFVVSTFVIVEMAEDGNEGLVYGLLTTTSNIGKSMPQAISNQVFGRFSPALSDPSNYIKAKGGDQPCFRTIVAYSFLVAYAFSFSSLITLPLMPDQRMDAQARKRWWPHHTNYGIATTVIVVLAYAYALTVNVLSMFPSTMCLEWVGGQGCGNVTVASFNATTC